MDGVLIDSEPLHTRAHINMLADLGHTLDPDYVYEHFIGSTPRFVWETLQKKFGLSQSWQELDQMDQQYRELIFREEGYPPIPYARDLLMKIQGAGLKMALASSSPPEQIRAVLQALDLDSFFETLVSGSEVPRSKPHPDIFLEAASRLHVKPEECIVIEDSHHGVLAGCAAGMTVIGYLNPHSGKQDLSKADVLIDSFKHIDVSFLINEFRRHHGQPVTIACTERLLIRELTTDDIPALLDLYHEEGMEQFIDDIPEDEEQEIARHRAYIREVYGFYGFGIWGVFLKETGQLMGYCGFQSQTIEQKQEMELSYLIHRDFRRQGYGLEAMRAILAFGREDLEITDFTALIAEENLASAAFAERLGLRFEKEVLFHGKKRKLYRVDYRREAARERALKQLKDKSPVYRRIYPD